MNSSPDPFIPRTRTEKHICRAASLKGWTVVALYYSNDRTNYEMQGDTSGWVGFMQQQGVEKMIFGYNVGEVVASITDEAGSDGEW